MKEFETVIDLLFNGNVEKAASEFSDAVYARHQELVDEANAEKGEDKDESEIS